MSARSIFAIFTFAFLFATTDVVWAESTPTPAPAPENAKPADVTPVPTAQPAPVPAPEPASPQELWGLVKKYYLEKDLEKMYALYTANFRARMPFPEFKNKIEVNYAGKVERFRKIEFGTVSEYQEGGEKYCKFTLKIEGKEASGGVMKLEESKWRLQEFH